MYLTRNKKGFTLIELMVASSIFIIVMVISIGAVLSIVDANRKAQSIQSVMTNLNFALESMVRDMREGSDYCAVEGCPYYSTANPTISFTNSSLKQVAYQFVQQASADCPGVATGSICKIMIDSGGTFSSITAPEVHITSMYFQPRGRGSSDKEQPIVILLIRGQAGLNTKTQSTFRIQTLITQRLLDG